MLYRPRSSNESNPNSLCLPPTLGAVEVDDAQRHSICAPDVGGEFEQSVGNAEGRGVGSRRVKRPDFSFVLTWLFSVLKELASATSYLYSLASDKAVCFYLLTDCICIAHQHLTSKSIQCIKFVHARLDCICTSMCTD